MHESYTLTGHPGCLRQHVLQYPWDTLEIATANLQCYSTLMAATGLSWQRFTPTTGS